MVDQNSMSFQFLTGGKLTGFTFPPNLKTLATPMTQQQPDYQSQSALVSVQKSVRNYDALCKRVGRDWHNRPSQAWKRPFWPGKGSIQADMRPTSVVWK